MLFTFATLLALAAAIPHPIDRIGNIVARSGKPCKTDGALVCNGDGSKFAICSYGHAIFQPVGAGTTCACSGGDDNACVIASADNGGPPASPPSETPEASSHKPEHGHKQQNQLKHQNNPAPKQEKTPHEPPTAAPVPPSGGVSYKLYLGNGSPDQGWPTKSEWVSFDTLWSINLKSRISSSCADFGEPNNSPEESEEIRKAVLAQSKAAGVDPRLALAMLVQESGGCVRVPTTNYGVNNPGLFQSHNGQGTCADVTPCPDYEIKQMVKDGVSGTADGDGLSGVIQAAEKQGYEGVAADYAGLRIYNSGSIAESGQLQDGIATHCYVSDIANRLTGWTQGASTCNLD